MKCNIMFFFFSSIRRHTRFSRDWSSDVCSSDLERAEHTGTLEVQTGDGAGMLLIVRGRVANVYWETASGLVFEKGEARTKLNAALKREKASLYLAEFSRETWKARTEVTAPSRHRLDRPGAGPLPHEAAALGAQVLGEMLGQFPSLLHAILFELTTGAVLARVGPGAADPGLEALTRRIPAFTTFLRNQTGGPGEEDGLDYIELSMARVSVLVAMVPEALEAVAVVSDRTQPIPLAGAALRQAAADYAGRLRVLRQGAPDCPLTRPSPRPRSRRG